jgi:asparagine synthase (glutamine-hydrolysing)
MAVSLEVRSPYLDVGFVEPVNAMPSRMKLRGFTRKYILKKSLEGKLPKRVLNRAKKGFGIPLAKWFRKDLKPLLLDTFSPSRLRRAGIFDDAAVKHLLEDHFHGRRDNRKQIWTLLVFEMWKERFA